MFPETFLKTENELRNAVLQGRFKEVEQLGVMYCAVAETHARQLAPNDPALGQVAERVAEMLEWARVMLCTARATLAEELRQVPFVKKYAGSVEPASPAMRVDL